MEEFSIFEHVKGHLLAFCYKDGDVDCFTTCFQRWSDVEYLEEFFEINKEDVTGEFYKETVENAVVKTLKESKLFKKQILDIANGRGNLELEKLFKPLTDTEPLTRQRNKSYGIEKNSWLRIYAIRLGKNLFIITGGCIKLTKEMKDRSHTRDELKALDVAFQYLKEMGIDDGTDYGYLEIEN